MIIQGYKCTKCGGESFHRLKRLWWMHFIPQSRLMRCKTCDHEFLSTILDFNPNFAERIASYYLVVVCVVLFAVYLSLFFFAPYMPGIIVRYMPAIRKAMKYLHSVLGILLFGVGIVWMAIRAFRSSFAWGVTFILTASLAQYLHRFAYKSQSWLPVKCEIAGAVVYCIGLGYGFS